MAEKEIVTDVAKQQHEEIGVKQDKGVLYKYNEHPDAQWFKDDVNLGLFFHFGISSVDGAVDLSWGMIADTPWTNLLGCEYHITPRKYWELAKEFKPDKFEAELENLIITAKSVGFKYAVLTTRHHDGFALWPSKYGNFNIGMYQKGMDIVKIYVDVCRRNGFRVGFYYSPPDWYIWKDYKSFHYGSEKWEGVPHYDIDHKIMKEIAVPDEKFMDDYRKYVGDQVRELLTNYGKIDVLWFDGSCEEPEKAITLNEIYQLQPGIVVNDRMHGYGDFTTSEVRMPDDRPANVWEHCDILSEGPSWGYVYPFRKLRSAQWLYSRYQKCMEWGGNLLMNIGPKDDGSMPEGVHERLLEFGELLKNRGDLHDMEN